MPEATQTAEVRKEVTVDAPIDVAFRVFTQEIATWWPMKTHSRLDGRATRVTLEGRLGGRLYETAPGEENHWGSVTEWDPPHRVAFSWKPKARNLDMDDDDENDTLVTVAFEPIGAGTKVTLVHTGWEKYGAELGREAATAYRTGWDYVVGQFAARVSGHAG
jgi:uncharacterized protein YndB with AHSA1/START domain